MAFSTTLYRNANRSNRLDGNYPAGDAPALVYGIELAWDIPTQYTDTSRYFPKTYKIEYGTSTGVYDTTVDMSTDTDPAMLSKQITGLSNGTTYYAVVKAVDSEGYESAVSSEVAIAAAEIVPASDPTSFTEIGQADLPYTINSSGNYRITENLSYDVSQGSAITISADDVTLFAYESDNIVMTVGTTNDVIGIKTTGARDNINIHGFHITAGGNETTSTFSHGHVYFDNAGNSITDLTIRDMEFTVGKANTNMTGTQTAYGAVVFRAPTGTGVTGNIYDCTFNLKGTKAGSGVRGVSLESGGSAPNLVIHDNTFNCSDVTGSVTGYQRAIEGGQEAYGNTFNITNCSFSSFGVVGIRGPSYTHNNTFNVTNSGAVRCILDENDVAGNNHLYNSLNIISTTGSGDVRLFRTRFGANDNVYGFNTASGNNQSLALSLMDIYGTQVEYGDTRNNYLYSNTASGMTYGLLHCQEQAENTYCWSNTADSTNTYGLELRATSSGDNANGMYFNGDDINGSTSDVKLTTGGAYSACDATHFAGLGAISISNNDPVNTVAETNYWVDGDAGLTTHTQKNTGSKTPNAPSNVRAA